MNPVIREMTPDDHDDVVALWKDSPGVGLSDADSRECVSAFLERNPGMSLVAREGGRVVGAVLCGHDGRRGYISHLAVRESQRKAGLGRELVRLSLEALEGARIQKCHVVVFSENGTARSFWEAVGWTERVELSLFSAFTGRGGGGPLSDKK